MNHQYSVVKCAYMYVRKLTAVCSPLAVLCGYPPKEIQTYKPLATLRSLNMRSGETIIIEELSKPRVWKTSSEALSESRMRKTSSEVLHQDVPGRLTRK